MNAFVAAAEDLAQDEHIALACQFQPAAGGAPVALRARIIRVEDAYGVLDGGRAQGVSTRAMIATTALPTRPLAKDLLAVDDVAANPAEWRGLVFTVMEVAEGNHGATWTCALRRA